MVDFWHHQSIFSLFAPQKAVDDSCGSRRNDMPSKLRMQRIADRICEELSEMIIKEVNDPRLSGISITGAKVDRELSYADIYVSAVEGQTRSNDVIEGLQHANGFLRRRLAERIELRVFPRLRFHWDPTPERADHIERLLAELRQEQPSSSENQTQDGE
jgi:ribosome-binding factor A